MACLTPNWSWAVLFGSFLSFFMADGWSYTFGMLYPDLIEEFDESRGVTAYVPTLLYGIPMILSPFACSAVTRVGCRALGVFGGVLFGLSLVVASVTNSFWSVCLAIGVFTSIGLVAVYISAYIAVTYWFDEGKRGFATGIAVAGSGLGSVVFPHIINWLMARYVWQGTILIVAGISFHAAFSGLLYRPSQNLAKVLLKSDNRDDGTLLEIRTPGIVGAEGEPSNRKEKQEEPKSKPANVGLDILKDSLPNCSLLRNKVFCLYCFANFVLYLWVSIPYLYIYDWAIKTAKLDHDRSTWLLSALGLSRTVGQIVVGLLGDRKGLSPNFLVGLCISVTGISTLLIPFTLHFIPLLICCIAFGFTVSSTYVLPMLCMGEIIGFERAVAGLGLLQFVQGLATLSGTPIGGWIYDVTKSYDAAFVVSGVLMIVSSLLFCFIPWLLKISFCKSYVADAGKDGDDI